MERKLYIKYELDKIQTASRQTKYRNSRGKCEKYSYLRFLHLIFNLDENMVEKLGENGEMENVKIEKKDITSLHLIISFKFIEFCKI